MQESNAPSMDRPGSRGVKLQVSPDAGVQGLGGWREPGGVSACSWPQRCETRRAQNFSDEHVSVHFPSAYGPGIWRRDERVERNRLLDHKSSSREWVWMSQTQQQSQPSFFPTSAIDHAAAGLGAGVVAVLCMHPLDLLKVKFQVATDKPKGGIGRAIWNSLKEIQARDGWRGLYRGVGANIAGNASSWGFYFLFVGGHEAECAGDLSYHMLKQRASGGDPNYKLSPGAYLLCSAEASAVTAIMTNPIWVVKVRMFTTAPKDPNAYRSLWHGLSSVYRQEGMAGLYRGTTLALFGVSNGAIQFMVYEELKRSGFERKKRQFAKAGREYTTADDKLREQLVEFATQSNTAYTLMSGASKLIALASTYPYQVVRSRIQNNRTAHLYPTIPECIKRTFAEEGFRGFYRGLGTNLVRVLPGTCVTFVVYENLAWLLRSTAARRERRKQLEAQS
ncbi:mitochondrial carrier [Trametes sanguinea]|nr:mitochondrial carrier [Trametes sanguinea]